MPMPPIKEKKNSSLSRGFTLVELLVTIALFSILVSIAVGGFVRALRTERDVSGMMSTESNASIALEEMTREMRTGYLFTPLSCTGAQQPLSCAGIQFFNANGQQVTYARGANGALTRTTTSSEPLMGGNVSTTFLSFTIFGDVNGNDTTHWPPRVTIDLGVAPSSTNLPSVINLQTTVSARGIFQ